MDVTFMYTMVHDRTVSDVTVSATKKRSQFAVQHVGSGLRSYLQVGSHMRMDCASRVMGRNDKMG